MIFELILILISGWLLGASLNYLADVLPRTRSFSKVPCIYCNEPYRFGDYLRLQHCKTCQKSRSKRAWIVQLLSIIIMGVVWFFPPTRFGFWLTLPYLIYFATVFIIDVEHHVILHEVSIVGALLAIPLGIIWNGIVMTIIGGVAGFALMLVLYYFGILFNRAMSRRRGETIDEVALGFGDVNLSGVLGLILGWPKIGISLFFSVILGGLASGIYLLIAALTRKYQAFTAIPYAPFLIIAAVILIYLA
jgi:leader peptidase (prepilin peptidase) / N-methyltransferase